VVAEAIANNLDLRQAAARVEAARQTVIVVGSQLKPQIGARFGVSGTHFEDQDGAIAASFPALPPPVPAGLPSSLLERRPGIVAAERQVLAAFRTEEAAKLALLPSFSLTLDGGRLGDELLSVLELNPWLVHGAIGMDAPIYTGGALTAKVKIATAQQQRAVANYGAVALAAFNEVEGALTNQELLAQRLPYQEQAVADRSESVHVARMQYKAGTSDLLSVLQLQEADLAAEADLIKLHNAQLANRIQLHLALGGSFDKQPAESRAGPD
jgi:multidrug efflux system outer membrane protein